MSTGYRIWLLAVTLLLLLLLWLDHLAWEWTIGIIIASALFGVGVSATLDRLGK